jgi:hypothetical protein
MPDDDLTPTDEQVRRLLADARYTEPMPADVADRLDGVLAGLQESHHDDPVVRPLRRSAADIAAAERRRRVRNWLVAAAAVVVVGVGVNQVDWSGMSSSGDDAESSNSDAGVAAESGGDEDAEAPSAASQRYQARWRMPRLHLSAERFGDQVSKFRTDDSADFGELTSTTDSYLADGNAAQEYSPVCDVGDLGRGYVVPVKYDDERAWLVFRKPEGESQVVDLYVCGRDDPTRSITLPTP